MNKPFIFIVPVLIVALSYTNIAFSESSQKSSRASVTTQSTSQTVERTMLVREPGERAKVTSDKANASIEPVGQSLRPEATGQGSTADSIKISDQIQRQ